MNQDDLKTLTPEDIQLHVNQQNKGAATQLLLADPILKDALSSIKADALECTVSNAPGSKEAVHFHYLYIAIGELEKELQAYVHGGEYSSIILKELEALKEDNEPKRVWIDPPTK